MRERVQKIVLLHDTAQDCKKLRSGSAVYNNIFDIENDSNNRYNVLKENPKTIIIRVYNDTTEEDEKMTVDILKIITSEDEHTSVTMPDNFSLESVENAFDTIVFFMYEDDTYTKRLVELSVRTVFAKGLRSKMVCEAVKKATHNNDVITLEDYFRNVVKKKDLTQLTNAYVGSADESSLTLELSNNVLEAITQTVSAKHLQQPVTTKIVQCCQEVAELLKKTGACFSDTDNILTHGPFWDAIGEEQMQQLRQLANLKSENEKISNREKEVMSREPTNRKRIARYQRRLKSLKKELKNAKRQYKQFTVAGLQTFVSAKTPHTWRSFFTREHKRAVIKAILNSVVHGKQFKQYGYDALDKNYTKVFSTLNNQNGCLKMKCEALTADGFNCQTHIQLASGIIQHTDNIARDIQLVYKDAPATEVRVCRQPVKYLATTNKQKRDQNTLLFKSLVEVALDASEGRELTVKALCNRHAKKRDRMGAIPFETQQHKLRGFH